VSARRAAETVLSKLVAAVRIAGNYRHVAGTLKEIAMKQYLLSVCYPAGGKPPPPEALHRIMRDVHAVQKEMQAAAVWVFSGGLHPANTATVLRQQSGEVIATDGPFIESKEQIGGITILKAPDLDAALDWGRKLARAIGTPIEVRPFQENH
jgi:hypothetical protein